MYLVFDIGGTKTRVAISDGQNLLDKQVFPTPKNYQEGVELIIKTARQLIGNQKIDSAVGGVRSPLQSDKSTLFNDQILSDWVGKSLKDELEKQLGIPVRLENDAKLAGIAESTLGAGKGYKIVAYLTISTGVGGLRIVNGDIDKNAFGFAPGHQIIVIDGEPCSCGGNGHLESYISGTAIEKKFEQKPEEIKDPLIWNQVAKALAIGLTNTVVHWSPDIVILGGGVTQSIPLEEVNRSLKKYLTIFPQTPEVKKGELGDDAGLLGAVKYIQDNKNG